MADFGRRRQRCSERPVPIHQRDPREELARRLRPMLLLAPQGEALLEDLNPRRRCGRAKLKVN